MIKTVYKKKKGKTTRVTKMGTQSVCKKRGIAGKKAP